MPRLVNMTLEEKGNFQPPIRLPKYAESVSQYVQSLPKVISATHWDLFNLARPDGADFYLGKFELGHIHIGGDVHIPMTANILTLLLSSGAAEKAPWGYGWLRFKIESRQDVDHAKALFRINYLRLTKASSSTIRREVDLLKWQSRTMGKSIESK